MMMPDEFPSNSDEEWNEEDESGAPHSLNRSHPPRRAIPSFNLEEMSERTHLALAELCHTDEFQ
jgi:hypothetical protein